MYRCLHTCLHTCLYTYIPIYLYTYLHTCLYTCLYTYLYTYLHTCLYTCLYTYLYTSIVNFNVHIMNLHQNIILEPDYLLEKIDNEITVYHPTLTTSLYLNETGGLIWELCDGQRSVADIIDILTELYPENSTQVADGVKDIISRLLENNIARLQS